MVYSTIDSFKIANKNALTKSYTTVTVKKNIDIIIKYNKVAVK